MTDSFLKDKAGANALPVPHRASIDMGSAEFFERARARLNFEVPPALSDPSIIAKTGDQGTDWMLEIIAREKPIRQAAVLIGIVAREQPSVLLTTRATHLSEHPGQISFPGGKIDPQDASPLDAALREAREEVGLAPDFIEPVGYLDVYSTSFGFRILPTLARIRPGFDLTLNTEEVDDAFEVPLAFLMDPENHKKGTKEYRGKLRYFYEMPYEQRYIWGATAGMLRVLYERIYTP
ncbi:Putative NUDIX hydrolase OS=Afipia felis OX=1035 GN=BN961_02370 PE=4 SV=1 [Afipia felis]